MKLLLSVPSRASVRETKLDNKFENVYLDHDFQLDLQFRICLLICRINFEANERL